MAKRTVNLIEILADARAGIDDFGEILNALNRFISVDHVTDRACRAQVMSQDDLDAQLQMSVVRRDPALQE
ncbi:MAG: hypothetical protein ACLP5H_13995 [Desulfomonilaceae bacterium]